MLPIKKTSTSSKHINHISFKNIHQKSRLKDDHSHHDLSMSPIPTKRNKTNTCRGNSTIIQT